MQTDNFIFSLLFDDQKTSESAKKVETTVENLKNKILGAFTAILSTDFLKNAVESSVQLATKLDNLSYSTNVSKEQLSSWGEAAKRSGGSVEGFYSSVSSLAEKLREMQTNFGSSGQLVFARLGISIKDTSGNVKNAVDIFEELGDKFKDLPKVWQQSLGKQLGLDESTIRLISQGGEESQKLVSNMAKLGQINQLNTEKNIKFRNTLFDISLVFESIKLKIADLLLPALQKFSEFFLRALTFLQDHSLAVKSVIIALSAVITGVLIRALVLLIPTFISAAAAAASFTSSLLLNPITLWSTAIAAVGVVIEDFITWLHGGESALGKYYDKLASVYEKTKEFLGIKREKKSDEDQLVELEKIDPISGNETKREKKVIQEKITEASLKIGVDPSVATTIASIESSLNPDAKNSKSTASGVFQLTDATANSNGIMDLSKKNNVNENIRAGVLNLKKVSDGLTKFLGRKPTGSEVFLGEQLGLGGSRSVLSADQGSLLSTLLSPQAIKSNPQFKNMTAGQLISSSNKTYSQKSVTVGEVKINAPGANAREIAQNIDGALQKQLSGVATNFENGVRN